MFIFFMVDFENSSRKYVDRLLVCFFVREGHFMYKKDICSGSKGSCWISLFRRTSFIEQELNTISQRNYIINKMRFVYFFPVSHSISDALNLGVCFDVLLNGPANLRVLICIRQKKTFGIIIHSWNAINSILHRCVFFSSLEIPIRSVCIACEKKVESVFLCVSLFTSIQFPFGIARFGNCQSPSDCLHTSDNKKIRTRILVHYYGIIALAQSYSINLSFSFCLENPE